MQYSTYTKYFTPTQNHENIKFTKMLVSMQKN